MSRPKLFAVVQMEEAKAWCHGSCGKALVGLYELFPGVSAIACKSEECPHRAHLQSLASEYEVEDLAEIYDVAKQDLDRATADLRAKLFETQAHVAELQDSIRNSAERRELEVARIELKQAQDERDEARKQWKVAEDQERGAKEKLEMVGEESDSRYAQLVEAQQAYFALQATLARRTVLLWAIRNGDYNGRRGNLETRNAHIDAELRADAPAAQPGKVEVDERKYPCADCGCMRTKAEGGTVFTVCEDCMDKEPGKAEPPRGKCDHPCYLRIGSADMLGRITSKCGACGETLDDLTMPAPVMPLLGPPRNAQPGESAQPAPAAPESAHPTGMEKLTTAIAEFEKRFPGEDLGAVKTWIERHGLDVLSTDPVWALNNLAIDVRTEIQEGCVNAAPETQGEAGEVAPHPGEVTMTAFDRERGFVIGDNSMRSPEPGCQGPWLHRTAIRKAASADIRANVARETEALRKRVEELQNGVDAANRRIISACIERDEARAQRDSLQAAATRLEANKAGIVAELKSVNEELEEAKRELGIVHVSDHQGVWYWQGMEISDPVSLTGDEVIGVFDNWADVNWNPGKELRDDFARMLEGARQAKEAAAKVGAK